MPKTTELRRAWTEANQQVPEAEERVDAAWAAFAAHKGGPPDKALLEDVARLRQECDRRLAAILDSYSRPHETERPHFVKGPDAG